MKQGFAPALLALAVLAACSTVPQPTPPGTGAATRVFELDPRLGWTPPAGAVATSDATAFERAVADLAAGRRARGQQRLAEIERQSPAFAPSRLARGALALEEGDLARATPLIEAAAKSQPRWTAAEFYLARVETERGDLEAAAGRLRAIASPGAPPVIAARLAEVETRLFERFYQAAAGAPPATAIESLRKALSVRPDSSAARLLLVQNLLATRNFTQARMEIDPLLRAPGADAPEVQQALAEIEAGRGQYEEAIERYERIVRAAPRPEYSARLEAIKQEYASANMPPRFRSAAASPELTRAELATLVYWTVSGVRFGRPPAEPAIAVDIAGAEAREEIVRAIAFGLFPVDPLTRRVYPDRTMTAANAARVLVRVLSITANPPCLADADTSQLAGTASALAACGIDTSGLRGDPNAPVSGTWALGALRSLDRMRAR
jgi:tetratricopeptide (TPR) repeat protein